MIFGMPYLLETSSPAQAAALCAEAGLTFVELNMNFPACQVRNLDPAELMRLRHDCGIFFTFHVEEDANPFSFNPAVRRAWLDSLRDTLILAQAVDALIVNMHLPRGVHITLPETRVDLHEAYREETFEAARSLRDMADRLLEGSDVCLTVENTDGWTAFEKSLVDFLLESPNFGLTLDIGHCHAAGDADLPFFLDRRDRLAHMHAHDAQGRRCHLALGDGEIDLTACLALSADAGARVVLETKTVAALRTSVSRLPSLLP